MQLIDVTNNYAQAIRQQWLKTSAHFIKVFTLGNSKVVYRKKRDVAEIVISNKIRPVTDKEISYVEDELFGQDSSKATVTNEGKIVEISLNN